MWERPHRSVELAFVLVDALGFVLVDALGFVLVHALGFVHVDALGFVLVEVRFGLVVSLSTETRNIVNL